MTARGGKAPRASVALHVPRHGTVSERPYSLVTHEPDGPSTNPAIFVNRCELVSIIEAAEQALELTPRAHLEDAGRRAVHAEHTITTLVDELEATRERLDAARQGNAALTRRVESLTMFGDQLTRELEERKHAERPRGRTRRRTRRRREPSVVKAAGTLSRWVASQLVELGAVREKAGRAMDAIDHELMRRAAGEPSAVESELDAVFDALDGRRAPAPGPAAAAPFTDAAGNPHPTRAAARAANDALARQPGSEVEKMADDNRTRRAAEPMLAPGIVAVSAAELEPGECFALEEGAPGAYVFLEGATGAGGDYIIGWEPALGHVQCPDAVYKAPARWVGEPSLKKLLEGIPAEWRGGES